jgi:predicted NBD/HSP70 family sugar kinase
LYTWESLNFVPIEKSAQNHQRGKGRPRNSEAATASLVAVLNHVRLSEATTRQELEHVSEYGRAIIADRLAILSELGLLNESETGVASGGRAPRLVQFSKDHARLVVVTLDQSAIGVGLADLNGKLLMEHHEEINITNKTLTADRICALINWLMTRLTRQPKTPDLWGISISVPGPVLTNPNIPFLLETPNFLPDWENIGLVETLMQRFKAPVWMHSNVETMTMGELHGGAGIDQQTMLFVKVGQRIGAGLVSNGQPYHGAAGAVGLIGQLPVTSGNTTGSLDAMAGASMIEARGIKAAQSGESAYLAEMLERGTSITAIEVCQAAQMGDAVSTEIVMQSGRLIGGVVATLANMLNPQLIVFAGSIAQTNDILLASVRETVYGSSHPLVTRDLHILRSQMSNSAALLGAAVIAVSSLFDPVFLKDWILLGSPTQHPDFVSGLETLNTSTQQADDGPRAPLSS